MREWNLKEGDPLSLTLAADARLCTPDYLQDQIWELRLRGGEPAALNIHTTYGLRARDMRLFLRFCEGDANVLDPRDYASPPAIHRIAPNYLLLTFSPFSGIDVVHEFWVPESVALAGRLRVINSGVTPRRLRFDLIASLLPAEQGQRLVHTRLQGVTVLQGRTENLNPTVFLTGGPQAITSPYHCLSQKLELLPGQERQFTWVHAALEDAEESFAHARAIASRPWEAEIARIEMINASQVEIETGEPDWDVAFALAQKVALGLVHGPTQHLPYASFVISRGPDHGYSMRGDGSDYNYLWNGQNALDSWYLAQIILPAAPAVAAGILGNFLATQAQDGYVDWKPGLGGQRTRLDATPLLATLAWEIYQVTQDGEFLRENFAELLTFVLGWFSPYHDRDGDGIPEWDHPIQSGFEDHPTFAHWHSWSQGVDIATSESPALCALLYREIQSLIHIARAISRLEPIRPLTALLDSLRETVESQWDGRSSIYRYRDRDTHRNSRGVDILEQQGQGTRRFRRKFRQPQRLQVRIQLETRATRTGSVTFYGTSLEGEKIQEHLPADKMRWYLGMGMGTSEQVYAGIHRIEVNDITPHAMVSVRGVDLRQQDHSLLLPLYAGIPDTKRAKVLVEKTIINPRRFGGSYGIPACVDAPAEDDATLCSAIWMPWNALIGDGLLAYGYRAKAADLVSRLMSAVTETLRRERAFRSLYKVETGRGLGDRNALNGLPPLGLFLKTLGVGLISSWQVKLEGHNPFPWPVKVKYRGMTVLRNDSSTLVTFPNGQSITIDDPNPCLVDGRAQG